MSRIFTYTHECECGNNIDFEVDPGCEAKLSGRPEDCYPEEPESISGPETCDKCGAKLDHETILDDALKKATDSWLPDEEE